MKRLFFAAVALAATMMALSSCFVQVRSNFTKGMAPASDTLVTETFTPGDFKEISFTAFDMEYHQISEGEDSIEVTLDKNYVDYLEVRNDDGILDIDLNLTNFISRGMLVKVYSKTLEGISIAGSSDAKIPGGLVTEKFNVSIAGSGDLVVNGLRSKSVSMSIAGSGDIITKDLDCGNVEVSIAGSGDVTLSGKAEYGSFSIAGSGDIDIRNLAVEQVNTKVMGSGSVER